MCHPYQKLTFFVLAALSFGVAAQTTSSCLDKNGDAAVQLVGEGGTTFISEKGVTYNDDFFPFGEEVIVKKTEYLNPHYIARLSPKFRVLTRFAFKTGDQIVFIETTRKRKKALGAYFASLVKEELKNFLKPQSFDQHILTFEKNGRINSQHIHMEQQPREPDYFGERVPVMPVMSMNDIKDPKLFQRKELKETVNHMLDSDLDYGFLYSDVLISKKCN